MVETKPFISIIVPTYNRQAHLSILLNQMLKSSFLQRRRSEFEIIVANNKSTDGTGDFLRHLDHQGLFEIIHYEEHVKSGEENWYRTVRRTRGEYVWIIGDDDVIDFELLEQIWDDLKAHRGTVVFFNPLIYHPKRGVMCHSLVNINQRSLKVSFDQLVMDTGFWYLLAMFSASLLPGDAVRSFDFTAVRERSTIYSHVAAYIELFAKKSAVVMNLPIVWYRQIDDMGYYRRLARRFKVSTYYFWLGFIKHFKYLIDKGYLTYRQLFYCYEIHHEGSSRTSLALVYFTFWQVITSRRFFDPRERFTDKEFDDVQQFILNVEPYYKEILMDIEKIQKASPLYRFFCLPSEFLRKYKAYKKLQALFDYRFERLFIKRYGSWNIYFQGHRYCAVAAGSKGYVHLVKHMEVSDIAGCFYYSESLEGLLAKIEHVSAGDQKNQEWIKISEVQRSIRGRIRSLIVQFKIILKFI